MKKILTILLIAGSFCSCGSAQKTSTPPDSVPVGEAIQTEKSVPVGEAIPQDEDIAPARAQWLAEDQIIRDHIANVGISAQYTASGIYFVQTVAGSGEKPTATSNVTVHYTGKFMDGTIFDEGRDVTFPLNKVIAGWTEALQMVNEGGSISMIIPSYLAYGPNGRSGIPANSILMFDVDLVDVK